MKKQLIAAVTVASLLGFAGGTAVQAFNLGSILKVGGISVLVSKYGDSINDFLNKLLMKNGVGTDYATKVVPIVSVGTGKYIGAPGHRPISTGRKGQGRGSAGRRIQRHRPGQCPHPNGDDECHQPQPRPGRRRLGNNRFQVLMPSLSKAGVVK